MTIEINRSNNQDIDGILWGWAWGNGGPESLTFSFPTGTAEYTGYAAINGFSSFNVTQAEAVRDVLANIASFCNLTFIETTASGATLRYAEATSVNYTNDSNVARFTGLHSIGTAEATPPELAYNGVAPLTPGYAQGDSWYNPTGYDSPWLGSFAYAAGIMHETGHNLGLKHGHATQVGHGVTFPTLSADHNSYEYSVMTYSQFPGDSTADGDNAPHHPTTYMQSDIVALQYLYGANYGASAHNGDTVYTWNLSAGEASIDGIGQGAPIANYVLMTIWDGGGNDTYDLSNYTTNLSVNLNPGAWTILDTSAAHAQRANLGNTGGGPTYFARGNIANALTDPNNTAETASLIENAAGGNGNDVLVGNSIGNTLWGNGGSDVLVGGAGTDALHGGDGNDVLTSDGDAGVYFGDAGNDAMYSGLGNEYMDGGVGIDLIDHTIWSGDYTFDMTTGLTNWLGETYLNFELTRMGTGHDTVTGNAANNEIYGGGGNDTLTGGAGTDSLFGEAGDDTITSDGDAGQYFGDAGNDAMYSGLGNEYMDGGIGVDMISHISFTGDYTFDMTTGLTNWLGETYLNFEITRMGSGHDSVTGNAADNTIYGGNGNDRLTGGGGIDSLFGEAGDDTIISDGDAGQYFGEAGNDTMFSGLGDEFMDGGAGIDLIDHTIWNGDYVFDMTTGLTNFAGETYLNFENTRMGNGHDTVTGTAANNSIVGGGGHDTLTGGNGNDTLDGGADNDILDGGAGADNVSYASASAGVTVNLGLTAAQNTVGGGIDTLGNLENLRGSNFNDTLTGNAGSNIIIGGLGNDILNGGAGIDTVSYETASTGVTVTLLLTGAQNTVGAGTDTLSNFENLKGSNFHDTLTGNAGSNLLIGGLGNDILNGEAGTDTVSYETASTGVIVSLGLAGAQNTAGAGTDTLSNIENLKGSQFHDTLMGNTGANLFIGGLGNDILNGDAGVDTASYETASTGVTVNLGVAGAQNTIGAGTDTLTHIENLTGSNFNDTLTGNAGDNVLIGGLGDDILNGDAGSDTVSYGTATAGVTVSLLLAGAQNTVGAGIDTLSNVERLKGSNFNDTLTGNTGANILTGGTGNDSLTGSSGRDSFVFNTTLNVATNKDTITDFAPVDDTIVLENAIFTQFVANGAIPAGTFVANAGGIAGDANDYLLYDTTTGKLFYDADGNGAGAKVEFVTLVGIPALTAADLTIF